jgi:hypothetical protein
VASNGRHRPEHNTMHSLPRRNGGDTHGKLRGNRWFLGTLLPAEARRAEPVAGLSSDGVTLNRNASSPQCGSMEGNLALLPESYQLRTIADARTHAYAGGRNCDPELDSIKNAAELFSPSIEGDSEDEQPWDAVRVLRRRGSDEVFEPSPSTVAAGYPRPPQESTP